VVPPKAAPSKSPDQMDVVPPKPAPSKSPDQMDVVPPKPAPSKSPEQMDVDPPQPSDASTASPPPAPEPLAKPAEGGKAPEPFGAVDLNTMAGEGDDEKKESPPAVALETDVPSPEMGGGFGRYLALRCLELRSDANNSAILHEYAEVEGVSDAAKYRAHRLRFLVARDSESTPDKHMAIATDCLALYRATPTLIPALTLAARAVLHADQTQPIEDNADALPSDLHNLLLEKFGRKNQVSTEHKRLQRQWFDASNAAALGWTEFSFLSAEWGNWYRYEHSEQFGAHALLQLSIRLQDWQNFVKCLRLTWIQAGVRAVALMECLDRLEKARVEDYPDQALYKQILQMALETAIEALSPPSGDEDDEVDNWRRLEQRQELRVSDLLVKAWRVAKRREPEEANQPVPQSMEPATELLVAVEWLCHFKTVRLQGQKLSNLSIPRPEIYKKMIEDPRSRFTDDCLF